MQRICSIPICGTGFFFNSCPFQISSWLTRAVGRPFNLIFVAQRVRNYRSVRNHIFYFLAARRLPPPALRPRSCLLVFPFLRIFIFILFYFILLHLYMGRFASTENALDGPLYSLETPIHFNLINV